MVLDVVFDASDKCAPSSTRVAKLVLQYFDQRTVAGQEDGRCCRLDSRAWNGEIVNEMGMHETYFPHISRRLIANFPAGPTGAQAWRFCSASMSRSVSTSQSRSSFLALR